MRVIASSFILVWEEGRASWAQFPVCFRGLTQSTTEFHCWKEGLVHLDKKKKDFQKYEGTKVAKGPVGSVFCGVLWAGHNEKGHNEKGRQDSESMWAIWSILVFPLWARDTLLSSL